MNLQVHLLQKFDDRFTGALRGRLPEEIILTTGDQLPSAAEYQILIAGRPSREYLTASAQLHTLIIPWAGLPPTTRELMLEFPAIAVHNIHHNAAPTAEMAITLMLAATKELLPLDRGLRNNDWRPRYLEVGPPLLADRTAVILGYGAIGRLIARSCRGLGMKVCAVSRNPKSSTDGTIELFPVGELRQLLPRAEVLFVALPLTPETNNMLNEPELSLLPEGATVVNVARGVIINEQALFKLLTERRLRAGLDVWYNYPHEVAQRSNTDPANYPFHQLDNVVMTPHLAGHSDDIETLRINELVRMLARAVAGEPLPNRVDVARGY